MSKLENGGLPNGWTFLTMSEIGRWFGGGTPSKANPNFWTDGKIPWVSPKDMKFDLITDAQDHITEDAVAQSATNLVEAGSILIVVRSGILQHTLPIAVTQRQVALNQDIKAVKPLAHIRSDYLALALKAFERKILHTCTKTGTTVQSLELPVFLRFQIPVAPLPEQRRIVAEIERQFSRLDEGVAALKRAQANLARYRAAVLKAACEGKLVPTEAALAKAAKPGSKGPSSHASHPSPFESGSQLLARILAERRQKWQGRGKYKEPAAPDTAKLPQLPEGWAWATFEQVSERVTVGFVGPMKHEYVSAGIPFLRGQNVRENRFDPDGLLYVTPAFHSRLAKSAIVPGDLAVVRSGSVGVTCVIPDSLPEANCSDLVLVQRPLGFIPQYGAYFMNSLAKRVVEAGKVGVALTHFNTKSVAAMPIPLPPLAEQKRIVAEVERRLSVIDELEAVVARNLHRADRLRQAVLQKAFKGELA